MPISPADQNKAFQTLAFYAGFIALGLTSASAGPTLPGMAEQTHATLSQVSILFTARSLGYLAGSVPGGRWYDRFSGSRLQAIALAMMLACMALVPVMPLLWLLAALLVVLGFAEGMLDVGGNVLLVWVHGENVGPFMNGLHLFYGIGAFLSPIIIAQTVLATGGIRWAYWILALLLIPVLLQMARMPAPKIPANLMDTRAGTIRRPLVGIFILFFCTIVGAELSFGGWAFTYARALGLATETTAAYLTSAFWGGLTAGRVVAIPLATRIHPRWILLSDLLAAAASLAVILIFSGSYTAALIGAAGFGFAMASIYPTTMTLAGQMMPLTGQVTGLFFIGSSIGSMFFPWFIGQVFEPLGAPAAMWIILGAVVAALAVWSILILSHSANERR